MSDVMIKGEPRMTQNCTHKQLILGQQVRGHTFPGTNGFWVVFFSGNITPETHINSALLTVHSFIHPLTNRFFQPVWALRAAGGFCKVTRRQSVQLRTPHLQHRQLPRDNCFQAKIASIQTASWPDSHERASETKAPHNHHLLSFTCQINCASPAVEVAAPSEAAAMRCSFMSWQRNLFFYLPPELACHIYRSRLLSCPSVASARL